MREKYSTKTVLLSSLITTAFVLAVFVGVIHNERIIYKSAINTYISNNQAEIEALRASKEQSLQALRTGYEDQIQNLQFQTEGEIQHLTEVNKQLLAQNKSLIEQLDSVHTVEDKLLKYRITLSHYTASVDETDSNPQETATGTKPVVGRTLAVSRDLFKYLRGKKVWIEGLGVFTVEDTMNPRFTNKGDLLVRTKTEAKKLGVKKVTLVVLPDKV
jgi:3D (Asp-Asp-Asp) domain-containing protein